MWYPMDGVLKEPILIKELVANIEDPSALYYSFHDFNQDGFISKSEISELKNIIDSLK